MSSDKEINESIGDLRIIDDEQFEREYKKVMRALRLAEQASKADRKLTSSRSPIQRDADFGRGPASGTRIGAGQYLHPSATRLAQGRSPLATNQAVVKEKQREARNQFKREKDRAENGINFKGATTDALSLIKNPVGFIADKLPLILGIAGPVALALFAVKIAEQVFELIKSQFGAGGLFDVRKLVLDQVKSFSPIQTLINIKAGLVFFTSDAGQKLRQGAPQFSNTMQLRDNHRKFQLLHLGE